MLDTLVTEKFGQHYRSFVKFAASQLQKICLAIVCVYPEDSRILIGPKWQKFDLANVQSERALSSGNDFIVFKIGFFKHRGF